MTTTTRTTSRTATTAQQGREGWAGDGGRRPGFSPSGPGRRRLGWLAAGVALVAACGAGFAVIVSGADERQPVLVAARALPVGHPLAAGDLRSVKVAADPGVGVVPAGEARSLLGRPVAVAVTAGTPLNQAQVAYGGFPAPGEAVVAVAVKPGQYPPGLASGQRVELVPTPDADGGSAAAGTGSVGEATVLEVRPADEGAVVSVRMDEAGAAKAAPDAATGHLALVLLGGAK